jgi:serine/threonine protein kinase
VGNPYNVRYTSPTVNNSVSNDHRNLVNAWLGPESASMARVGRGSYGSVFRIQMTDAMKNTFDPVFRSKRDFPHIVGHLADIPTHKPVAMKIVTMPRGKNTRGGFASIWREMYTHWKLCHEDPKTVDGGQTVYDIRKVIPVLYAAGYDRKARAAIFFMELMTGNTLGDTVKLYWPKKLFPAEIAANVEYAVVCLFLNGYIHVDLHPGNIYVTPDNRVKIFDFGFSARIEKKYVYRFSVYLVTYGPDAIEAFWNDIGEKIGNAAVLARQKTYPGGVNRWFRDITIIQRLKQITDPTLLNFYRWRTWIPKQASQT